MSPIAIQRKHSIATMGADGIGPEVVSAAVQVLKKLVSLDESFELEFEDYDWSSETYKKTGKYIPDGGLEKLKKHDAILFGAVGAPDVPDHISSGASVWPSASLSNNMPTFAQPESSVELNLPSETHLMAIWTG